MGFNGISLVIWDDDPKIMLGESDGLTSCVFLWEDEWDAGWDGDTKSAFAKHHSMYVCIYIYILSPQIYRFNMIQQEAGVYVYIYITYIYIYYIHIELYWHAKRFVFGMVTRNTNQTATRSNLDG